MTPNLHNDFNFFVMRKQFLRIGSLLGMLAVALGAFGSHGLKGFVTPEAQAIFATGVQYHFYHALAVVAVGVLLHIRKTRWLEVAGWLFVIGIVLFSGSLYLLTFQDVMFEFPKAFVGPITPLGGLFFMAGWVFLFASTYQTSSKGLDGR